MSSEPRNRACSRDHPPNCPLNHMPAARTQEIGAHSTVRWHRAVIPKPEAKPPTSRPRIKGHPPLTHDLLARLRCASYSLLIWQIRQLERVSKTDPAGCRSLLRFARQGKRGSRDPGQVSARRPGRGSDRRRPRTRRRDGAGIRGSRCGRGDRIAHAVPARGGRRADPPHRTTRARGRRRPRPSGGHRQARGRGGRGVRQTRHRRQQRRRHHAERRC